MFKELLFGCCVIAAQKQPLGVFYKKSCFVRFGKFHRKTTVIESLFNKVADLQACNFTKKRLQHRCFPVKFVKFFRTTILKNICERLLLAGELWNYKTSSTWKLPLPRFKFWLKISGAIAVIISPRWRGNTHYGNDDIMKLTLHKKWSFPFRISSVNVTRSAVFPKFPKF